MRRKWNKGMCIRYAAIIMAGALCVGVTFGSAAAQFDVPYGVAIADRNLDGVIGTEWSDAASFNVQLQQYAGQRRYMVTVYTKHDGEYWYVAIVGEGSLPGGPLSLWIAFDVNGDGKFQWENYRGGDDSLILPDSNGVLRSDIDRAYTSTRSQDLEKIISRDTMLGGQNNKIGAGRFGSGKYVFETKIEMASGDAKGQDINVSPGGVQIAALGVMNDRNDTESPTYSFKFQSPPCTFAVSTAALTYCLGSQIPFKISNLGSSYCDFFSCAIDGQYKIAVFPPPPPIRSFTLFGLPAGGSATAVWDQRDSSGAQVPPGVYCIKCQGCSSAPLCVTIVDCQPPFPLPRLQPSPIPEPRPSEKPPSSQTPTGPVCSANPTFADTFDNVGSGWPTREDDSGIVGYDLAAQEYIIALNNAMSTTWYVNARAGSFSTFCLSVNAKQAEGAEEASYGVVFRYQNEDNFYLFTVTGDGHYSLHKRVDGLFIPLISHQAHSAINSMQSPNQLEVMAKGEEISLYANRQLLITVSDATFSDGLVGLFASPGAHVRFDDLKVYRER